MSLDVLTLGETMACLRARTVGPLRLGGSFRLGMAGAEATVAIGLVRLGHRAGWVGRLGDDEPGALVLRTLRAEGVDVRHVVVTGLAPTGLMLVEHRTRAVTRVLYHRRHGAGALLEPADVAAPLAEGARVLHVTGVTAALSQSALDAVTAAIGWAVATGMTVCLDVNYRSALWPRDRAASVLAPLAAQADVVVASAEELDLVAPSGRPADLLAGRCTEVVVTHGADGAEVTTAAGCVRRPAVAVDAADVLGAGDAFVAGYLSALLDGLDVAGRLERAVAVAAVAVGSPGDWEGLPTRAELQALPSAAGTTLR